MKAYILFYMQIMFITNFITYKYSDCNILIFASFIINFIKLKINIFKMLKNYQSD